LIEQSTYRVFGSSCLVTGSKKAPSQFDLNRLRPRDRSYLEIPRRVIAVASRDRATEQWVIYFTLAFCAFVLLVALFVI
jgi:hypothetical protein